MEGGIMEYLGKEYKNPWYPVGTLNTAFRRKSWKFIKEPIVYRGFLLAANEQYGKNCIDVIDPDTMICLDQMAGWEGAKQAVNERLNIVGQETYNYGIKDLNNVRR